MVRGRWSWPALVALSLALLPACALGERYVLSIGSLPPVIVPDSNTYTIQMEPEQDMVPCNAALMSKTLPAPTPVPAAPVPPAAPVLPNSSAAGAVAPYDEALMKLPRPSVDHDEVFNPPVPPTPAFDAYVRTTYSMSDAADVQGAYNFYLKEPAGIDESSRMSNAVIRHILELGKTPVGGSTARPDLLIAQPRTGSIRRGTATLFIRQDKWGAPNGQSFADGTSLTITPPAEEGWYHARGAGGEGWVPGLWVEAQP